MILQAHFSLIRLLIHLSNIVDYSVSLIFATFRGIKVSGCPVPSQKENKNKSNFMNHAALLGQHESYNVTALF